MNLLGIKIVWLIYVSKPIKAKPAAVPPQQYSYIENGKNPKAKAPFVQIWNPNIRPAIQAGYQGRNVMDGNANNYWLQQGKGKPSYEQYPVPKVQQAVPINRDAVSYKIVNPVRQTDDDQNYRANLNRNNDLKENELLASTLDEDPPRHNAKSTYLDSLEPSHDPNILLGSTSPSSPEEDVVINKTDDEDQSADDQQSPTSSPTAASHDTEFPSQQNTFASVYVNDDGRPSDVDENHRFAMNEEPATIESKLSQEAMTNEGEKDFAVDGDKPQFEDAQEEVGDLKINLPSVDVNYENSKKQEPFGTKWDFDSEEIDKDVLAVAINLNHVNNQPPMEKTSLSKTFHKNLTISRDLSLPITDDRKIHKNGDVLVQENEEPLQMQNSNNNSDDSMLLHVVKAFNQPPKLSKIVEERVGESDNSELMFESHEKLIPENDGASSILLDLTSPLEHIDDLNDEKTLFEKDDNTSNQSSDKLEQNENDSAIQLLKTENPDPIPQPWLEKTAASDSETVERNTEQAADAKMIDKQKVDDERKTNIVVPNFNEEQKLKFENYVVPDVHLSVDDILRKKQHGPNQIKMDSTNESILSEGRLDDASSNIETKVKFSSKKIDLTPGDNEMGKSANIYVKQSDKTDVKPIFTDFENNDIFGLYAEKESKEKTDNGIKTDKNKEIKIDNHLSQPEAVYQLMVVAQDSDLSPKNEKENEPKKSRSESAHPSFDASAYSAFLFFMLLFAFVFICFFLGGCSSLKNLMLVIFYGGKNGRLLWTKHGYTLLPQANHKSA